MDTKQAAQKWNISVRQVQRLLNDGFVSGAFKHGKIWMIPASSDKPNVLEKTEYKYIGAYHFPRNDVEKLIEIETEKGNEIAVKDLFYYLRGDYQKIIDSFEQINKNHPSMFNICFMVASSAISLNDYESFLKADLFLENIEKTSSIEKCARNAGFLRQLLRMDTYGKNYIPYWITDEKYFTCPPDMKLFMEFQYMKYLQTIENYEELRIVSRTMISLCFREDSFTNWEIYYYIFYAIACGYTNRREEGMKYLQTVMELALPHGFFVPFAEFYVMSSGMIQEALFKYPDYAEKIEKHANIVWNGWVNFHNIFTKENLTTILTVQEYQIALDLVRGKTYKEIAKNMTISYALCKKRINEIYEKLYVHNKSELKELLLNI